MARNSAARRRRPLHIQRKGEVGSPRSLGPTIPNRCASKRRVCGCQRLAPTTGTAIALCWYDVGGACKLVQAAANRAGGNAGGPGDGGYPAIARRSRLRRGNRATATLIKMRREGCKTVTNGAGVDHPSRPRKRSVIRETPIYPIGQSAWVRHSRPTRIANVRWMQGVA